jgi:hypothetical protein
MRTQVEIRKALEENSTQITAIERQLNQKLETLHEKEIHLKNLLKKAELNETGITVIVAKCEQETSFGRGSTFTITTTEGYVWGGIHRYKVGSKVKILPYFYEQIKQHHLQLKKAEEQGLTSCPICGGKLWNWIDKLECSECRKTVATWDKTAQKWYNLILEPLKKEA